MARTLTVTAPNALFQKTRSLATNRTARHRHGLLFVEGVRTITRALDHGWTFDSVWIVRGARRSEWAREVLERAKAHTIVETSEEVMRMLSDREEGSELVAVVRAEPDDLARIAIDDRAVVVVADRPSSPGNLGSLVRSADAFGARGVIVLGHAADPTDPQAIRASQGSYFAIPVVRAASAAVVAEWARERLTFVGADAAAETDAWDARLAPPVGIVVGNEARGMSAAARAICSRTVRIPMRGAADSLNVTSAATVLLYEIARKQKSSP